MFDRNQTTLSIRSRTMRLAGATIAGLATVALSLLVASTASADNRDRERDRNRAHVSVCRDQTHHHSQWSQGRHGHSRHLDRRHGRQYDSDHYSRHYSRHSSRHSANRNARWVSGLHLGLLIPQLQIRFDQPWREHHRDRAGHPDRRNERKHRSRRGHDRH
jgi:hypothetical protein